jgi:hypothetical protein
MFLSPPLAGNLIESLNDFFAIVMPWKEEMEMPGATKFSSFRPPRLTPKEVQMALHKEFGL